MRYIKLSRKLRRPSKIELRSWTLLWKTSKLNWHHKLRPSWWHLRDKRQRWHQKLNSLKIFKESSMPSYSTSLRASWSKRAQNLSKIYKISTQDQRTITFRIQSRSSFQVILCQTMIVVSTNWDTSRSKGTVKTRSTHHHYFQMASRGVWRFILMETARTLTVTTSQSSSRCIRVLLWCSLQSHKSMSTELRWYLTEVATKR